MFEKDFRNLLIDILDVPVYPLQIPSTEPASKAATYQVISNKRYREGKIGSYDIRDRAIKVNLVSNRYMDVAELSDSLVTTLDGYQSLFGDTKFHIVNITTEIDILHDDQKLYERSITLDIISQQNS